MGAKRSTVFSRFCFWFFFASTNFDPSYLCVKRRHVLRHFARIFKYAKSGGIFEDSSGLGRVFFLFFVAQACRCESNVNDFNSEKKDLEPLREITASTIRLRLIYL